MPTDVRRTCDWPRARNAAIACAARWLASDVIGALCMCTTSTRHPRRMTRHAARAESTPPDSRHMTRPAVPTGNPPGPDIRVTPHRAPAPSISMATVRAGDLSDTGHPSASWILAPTRRSSVGESTGYRLSPRVTRTQNEAGGVPGIRPRTASARASASRGTSHIGATDASPNTCPRRCSTAATSCASRAGRMSMCPRTGSTWATAHPSSASLMFRASRSANQRRLAPLSAISS